MALYFRAYDLIEHSAVPVSLAGKDFMASSWDQGYFLAKGPFENQSARVPGDELPLQANTVPCDRTAKSCTVASAQVFDQFLSIDTSTFDITSWTAQEITFNDDSPICAINSYVINRAAQTVTLIGRSGRLSPIMQRIRRFIPATTFRI